MRIILFTIILLFSFISRAQSLIINIPNKTKLVDALTEIQKQTGLIFSYSPANIDVNKKINFALNGELSDVLSRLSINNFEYKIYGKYIILYPIEKKIVSEQKQINEIEVYSDTITRDTSKINLLISSGDLNFACHNGITIQNDEQMKKKLLALVIAFSATQVYSQQQTNTQLITNEQSTKTEVEGLLQKAAKLIDDEKPEAEHKAFQFSFIYPIGTDGMSSKNYIYKLSINMLGAVTGGTSGVELSPLFNLNTKYNTGFQAAGIFNAGLYSENNVQLASVFNASAKGKPMAQISGGFNISAKAAKCQVASTVNVAALGNTEVQVAGILNVADSANVQVSLLNITNKGKLQVGIINIKDTADGLMIGLLNIPKKGMYTEFEVGGGSFINTYVAFRLGLPYLHTIASLGYNAQENIVTTGLGFGSIINFNPKLDLYLDLIGWQLLNTGTNDHLQQFTPTLQYKFTKHFKLYAGPTLNILETEYKENKESKSLNAIPSSIYSKTWSNKNELHIWIGGRVGFRF